MAIIRFHLAGNNISKSAYKLAKDISSYASTEASSMVGVPTSSISNSGAWTNKSQLRGYILSAMKVAFRGEKSSRRNKFGEDIAKYIDMWFMNVTNQTVASVTIPGSPPTVIPGPAVPNLNSVAKDVLSEDLLKVFTTTQIENFMSKGTARKKLNSAIQKYFDSFKVGGIQVWTLSPVKGYLST